MAAERCLIYCRVSTAGQAENGTSLQSQQAACEAYAQGRGYTVDQVVLESFSGAELFDRPKLNTVRETIRQGGVGVLLAFAVDRLSRDPVHMAILLQEVERAGCRVEFVTETLDGSPEGQLILYVKGYAAKIEREKIRERAMRGRKQRALNGKVPGASFSLYGYTKDREKGIREIYEPEAQVVRDMFHWRLTGVPTMDIPRRLNAAHIPPPSVGKMRYSDPNRVPLWSIGQIHRMLRDPAYKGQAFAWRTETPPGKPNGKRLRDKANWIALPASACPAIVDPEVFDAVQYLMNEGQRVWALNQDPTKQALLRGLVVCRCGSKMYRHAEPNGRLMYRCNSRRSKAGQCEKPRSAPAEALETWAWEQVCAILGDVETVEAEVRAMETAGPDVLREQEMQGYITALGKNTAKRSQLIAKLTAVEPGQGDFIDALETALTTLAEQRKDIEGKLAAAVARQGEADAALGRLEALRDYSDQVVHRLDSMDVTERRQAIEALAVQIVAYGREWVLYWSLPTSGKSGHVTYPSQTVRRCTTFPDPFRLCRHYTAPKPKRASPQTAEALDAAYAE